MTRLEQLGMCAEAKSTIFFPNLICFRFQSGPEAGGASDVNAAAKNVVSL